MPPLFFKLRQLLDMLLEYRRKYSPRLGLHVAFLLGCSLVCWFDWL